MAKFITRITPKKTDGFPGSLNHPEYRQHLQTLKKKKNLTNNDEKV